MPLSENRKYRYPSSGASPDLSAHLAVLADDVDADVTAVDASARRAILTADAARTTANNVQRSAEEAITQAQVSLRAANNVSATADAARRDATEALSLARASTAPADGAVAAFMASPSSATAQATLTAVEPLLRSQSALQAASVANNLRDVAAVYIDRPAGETLMEGGQVPDFEAYRSTVGSAVTADAIRVNPAYTNALPALSGTPGVIGSGGQLPAGWETAVNGVSKEVVAVSASSLVLQFGASPDRFFGGVRTAEITVPADQVLTLDASITGVEDSPLLSLNVSLLEGSSNRVTDTRVLFAGEPSRSLVLTLPAQDGPRRLQFLLTGWTAEDSAGRRPRLTLANMSMHPAQATGIRPSLQPMYAPGSTAARNVFLNVPPGDYVLLARTPRGVLSGAGKAGSAGLDLRAALGGSAVITRLAVIPSARYRPGLGDYDFPRKSTAVMGSGAAYLAPLSQAMDAPLLSGSGAAVRAPLLPRAVRTSRPGGGVFTLEPGDRSTQDGPTQERAEVRTETKLPYGESVWISDQFRVLEFDYTGAEQYTLMHQCLADPDPGDTASYSPEYSLTARPREDGSIRVAVLCRSGANTVTGSWEAFIKRGEWHHMVTEVRFARTGNGYLRLWLDGTKVYDQAVPVGYNRQAGPTFRFGSYARADTVRRVIEHANVEQSLGSLAHRISNPLPI